MFCPYCGRQTVDGAAFCAACGKALAPVAAQPQQPQQPAVDFQAQKNSVRQSEMKVLSDAMAYFSAKAEQFEAYDRICKLVNYYGRGAKSALIIWGCIIASFGMIGLTAFLSEPEVGFVMTCISLLPGILMIIGGILMKVKNRKNFKRCKAEYARLSQELYDHYVRYQDCPVGPEYVNPKILAFLMDYLNSGRADTIKECINLAMGDIKQRDYNRYMDAIAHHTASVNAQTKVTTFFAPAVFFK